MVQWYALIRLPRGNATTMFYESPTIIAIIAWVFLKEKLLKLMPIIFIFAVVGVIFISQPIFIIKGLVVDL